MVATDDSSGHNSKNSMRIQSSMFEWCSEPPEIKPGTVEVIEVNHFSARGMRRVYGRGDHFGGGRTFNLDIWKNRNGQIFMRCWSYYSDYYPRSFLISGVNPPLMPKVDGMPDLREEWIPQIVRDTYDEWAREEF